MKHPPPFQGIYDTPGGPSNEERHSWKRFGQSESSQVKTPKGRASFSILRQENFSGVSSVHKQNVSLSENEDEKEESQASHGEKPDKKLIGKDEKREKIREDVVLKKGAMKDEIMKRDRGEDNANLGEIEVEIFSAVSDNEQHSSESKQ